MKTTSFLSALAPFLSIASAFTGQVDYHVGSSPNPQIFLTDYATGSTYYSGAVILQADVWQTVYFTESSAGGYSFTARAKRTATNCFHVDFEGALGSGWELCCGGVPCDLYNH